MSTTSNDPDAIREQIELTRASLSQNVDALGDKVDPRRVVERQTDRVRGAVSSAKDAVFGTAEDVGERASHAASSASDRLSEAPAALTRRTQGNPWAAGLVAFGLGLLASSLIPSSRTERRLAETARDSEPVHQLTDTARAAASDVGESLREPARHAVESVKETAREGVATVQETARHGAEKVVDQAETGRDRVVDEAHRQTT